MPTLDWIGKDKVINHHNDVPYKVLERKYSYDEDGEHKDDIHSENMIIHGDNLEALKSLLPQYEGKIKCIYIDPPYNTRKSSEKNKAWIYSDSVDDPKIEKWLGVTVGDEGEDLSRHDKWLCMMYPRLVLLNKLLSDKGIVFISIDDNECSYLKIICDDIFGKKNFVAQLIWRSDGNFDNQAKIKNVHEYILCYIKNADEVGLPQAIDPSASENSKIYNEEVRNTVVKNGPKNPMSTIKLPIGFPCSVSDLIIKSRKDKFPYYGADAIIEGGRLINEVEVESGWSSKNILMKYINSGFNPVKDTKGQDTVFEITKTGNIEMIKKRGDASHVLSLLQNLGSTQNMSTELAKMGVKFDFPKPVELVIYLISFYCRKDDIILDSFAGSGTTAHAVLNMNKKDGGNRKFILVEMGDYADTITAERVKRVMGTTKRSVKRYIKKNVDETIIDRSIIEKAIAKTYLKMVCNTIYKKVDEDDNAGKEKAYKSFHILAGYLESKGITGIIYPCTRTKKIIGKNLVLFNRYDAVPIKDSIREIIYK